MPASALTPLNPFATELCRAAAGADAPDKAPSLRELSKISGVGRSAIGDWLAGKSLPRSWDDGAVLVVDAIIKLAARYGKRFPDEEAVRQRCKDAYYSAKSAQPANGTSSGCTPVLGVAATAGSAEAASRCAPDDRSGQGPVGSVPASGSGIPDGSVARQACGLSRCRLCSPDSHCGTDCVVVARRTVATGAADFTAHTAEVG